LINLNIFGATFEIGGAIASISPPGYAPVPYANHSTAQFIEN